MPLVGTITRALQFLFVARRGTTGAPALPVDWLNVQRLNALLLWRLEGALTGKSTTEAQAQAQAGLWVCRCGERLHDGG